MRILFVGDDGKLAGYTKHGLAEHGCEVSVASDGWVGEAAALEREYDLIILDLGLPDGEGLAICESLRRQSLQTPILMLACLETLEDCIMGLHGGADDYLIKPFNVEALKGAIRILLGRHGFAYSISLKARDVELDPITRRVRRAGEDVDLTPREFSLLEYLMRHQGHILSRTVLRDQVWNHDFDTGTNVIDVYINYLRRKIDDGTEYPLIQTVRGIGYVFKDRQAM